jgi:uncharacterized protein (TIGR02996 family)
MTDGDGLHAAILAAPDDDLPRLVYADWLDEQGGVDNALRAEFIRLQVALGHVSAEDDTPWDTRLVGLHAREKALLALHHQAWLAPLRARGEPFQSASTHGIFRRGFVEIVWMPVGIFLRKGEKLFQRAPVRELRVLRATVADLAELLACPLVDRLDTLDLSDRALGDAAAGLLIGQRVAIGWKSLRLRGCNLTDAGARQLSRAGPGWDLRELDVALNPISPAGLDALRARFGDRVVRVGRD